MKSYVTMEQHACVVCTKQYDTGSLLLDEQLRDRFEQHTVTACAGLCPDCKARSAQGYVALVGIDPDKSGRPLTPSSVWRTGMIAHIKRVVWDTVFNVPVPDGPMAFVPDEVISMLQERISDE